MAQSKPLTVEELVAMGYDRETAETIIKGAVDEGGSTAPFPILKLNYDQKDVLIDIGVKKGNFIHGYKVDNKTLQVTEKGEDLGNKIKFFVAGRIFQNSLYKDGKIVVQTKLFDSAYDSKKQIDVKSKKTIKQLKEVDKVEGITFNSILLLMVETPEGLKPYIHYLHGTNLAYFGKCLKEDFGVDNYMFRYTIEVESKKIPTQYQPAWVFHPLSVTERTQADIIKDVEATSKAMKAWNEWIASYNKSLLEADKPDSGSTSETTSNTTPTKREVVTDDIDEEDIDFG